MIIKRFQAKTEQEAVENAKKELGPGVVIMNVKNVKKKGLFAMFKKNMVEVTVALEEENERAPIPVKATSVKNETVVQPAQPDKAPVPLTALEQLALVQERELKEQREREEAQKNLVAAAANTVALEEKLDNLEILLKQQIDGTDSAKDTKGEEAEEDRFRKLDEAIRENLKKPKKKGLFKKKEKEKKEE